MAYGIITQKTHVLNTYLDLYLIITFFGLIYITKMIG